jgi:Na+/melibiose symporter-like transporter
MSTVSNLEDSAADILLRLRQAEKTVFTFKPSLLSGLIKLAVNNILLYNQSSPKLSNIFCFMTYKAVSTNYSIVLI